MQETQETSAGAVLYTVQDNKIFFLLVYSERNGEWGFPKGHIEKGETELEAARREIAEETGITETEFVKDFRFTDTYKIKGPLPSTLGRIIDKNVIYYLGLVKSDNGDLQKRSSDGDGEIGKTEWMNLERALKCLKYDKQKELLKKAYDKIKKGDKNESGIK